MNEILRIKIKKYIYRNIYYDYFYISWDNLSLVDGGECLSPTVSVEPGLNYLLFKCLIRPNMARSDGFTFIPALTSQADLWRPRAPRSGRRILCNVCLEMASQAPDRALWGGGGGGAVMSTC